jgi:hypothetical protein
MPPKSRFARLLSELFGLTPGVDAERVGVGNVAVAVIAGGYAWLHLQASLAGIAATIAATFVLLTACLLHRWTFWIAALLASTVTACAVATLFAAIGLRVDASFGGWLRGALGGALGFALGLYGTWPAYANLAQKIRKE